LRRFVHATALIIIAVLVVVAFSGVQTSCNQTESDSLVTGPYVDEVVFRVIANQDQRILAILNGEIEMDNSFFDPVHYQTLNADPDISITEAVRNGYGHITINCDKYPLNISGFRRAFAFAFNKEAVTVEHMDGFSIEHDSLVPLPNGWCIEDELDWHYYTAQPDIGNQILDNLNFTIDDETGYRNAPNGDPIHIEIEYAACSCEHAGGIASYGVEALESLHIDADYVSADFNDYISRLYRHGDYDMVTYAANFYTNDVDWLAYDYWSEYADVEYQNPTNFRNATYDSWRDQLLYGTTYEEVYEAAAEMQKILHYNVPRLVVYENSYMQAYRNDKFTGHVEDLQRYISGPWTMRKIHKIDGSFGGTVSIAISEEPDTFNFFVTNSAYSKAIMDNLWPSLYKYAPDQTPWPDLAESMLTETHTENPAVPEGHTRFTIDIIQNATWSDGEPVTAEDVAFTFTYAYESATFDNPASLEIGPLVGAYAITPYRVIIEFSTESYWHFSDFAYDYIIPEHIFNDETGIGYEGWNYWNPVFDPAEPHVTCGPFIFTDYDAGEYYKIEENGLFHHLPLYCIPCPTPTTNPISSNTTSEKSESILNWNTVLTISLTSGSAVVIIFCSVIIIQERRRMANI
jgi:ABC-type transport system substrate-binding protein